jgi:hypothetical protein
MHERNAHNQHKRWYEKCILGHVREVHVLFGAVEYAVGAVGAAFVGR